ncbi:hypothetical protein ACHAW6_007945 [Cyclotella cf. meneghiniana]
MLSSSEDQQLEDEEAKSLSCPPNTETSTATLLDRPTTATAVTEQVTAVTSNADLSASAFVSDSGNAFIFQGVSMEESAEIIKIANVSRIDIGDDGKAVSKADRLPGISIVENEKITVSTAFQDLLPQSENAIHPGADFDLLEFQATFPQATALDLLPNVFTNQESHDSSSAGDPLPSSIATHGSLFRDNDHAVNLFEKSADRSGQTQTIPSHKNSIPSSKIDGSADSTCAIDDTNSITMKPFGSQPGESGIMLSSNHASVANVEKVTSEANDGTEIADKSGETINQIIGNQPSAEPQGHFTVTAMIGDDGNLADDTEKKSTLVESANDGASNRKVSGDAMNEVDFSPFQVPMNEKNYFEKPREIVSTDELDEQPPVEDHVDQVEEKMCQPADSFLDKLSNETSIPHASTEEEAEWLSMGLGLSDALKQIIALTDERDAALAMCQGIEEHSDLTAKSEALLVEVQSRLQEEMVRRAESDSEVRRLREAMQRYEDQLMRYSNLEDEYEKVQANLVMVVSEKSKLEAEIVKLREFKDESEQQAVLLSNRLNEAKKKEASKSTEAGRLEAENEKLKEDLERTISDLDAMSKAKAKVESNMEKLKAKAVERVKQAETALAEERELNEERKRKMKSFVESKADELREAKESVSDMQIELQETRASLRSSREREESLQKDLEKSQIKCRELHRDMERLKRSQEEMHKMGSTLEHELEKSTSETDEHKKKRISAKHELMTMVRTLEVEKSVSGKLRESIKFTFTPKALSQQQLLNECLKDFEVELERLAIKLGKGLVLPPQSGEPEVIDSLSNAGTAEYQDVNGTNKKFKKNSRAAKADTDTERLISNLEHETQHVSKGIMSLAGSIERMRSLLNEDHSFNCMTYFSNVLAAAAGHGEARHQRLGADAGNDDRDETISITSFEQESSTL